MAILTRSGWRGWLGGLSVISILSISGCFSDGDDGATGPAGPAGSTSVVQSATPTSVDASISSATVAADGSLTIEFEILDQLGNGYVGLDDNAIRFTVAKLIPAGAAGSGEPSMWQSYINDTESAPDPADNVGSGTEDQIQADYERPADTTGGVFVDNGDGTYSYTLETKLTAVTSPLAVTYEPTLTHRVAFQLDGGLPPTNVTHDWQPSNGATTSLTARNIVTEDVCNSCHGKLAVHGTGRIATGYCVTCHNPGTVDANSANTVDFKVMVHKIHRGANLPSVVDGTPYKIWGFRDGEHDYSEVQFPQDIRNCDACHQESNTATPQASNWRLQPTIEACGSCHDDVNFATGAGHNDASGPGVGPRTNAECQSCHGEGQFAAVELFHTEVMADKDANRTKVVATPTSVIIDQGTGDITAVIELVLDGTPVDRVRLAADPTTDTTEGAKLGTYRSTDNGAVAINWDNGNGFQLNHREVALNDCVPDADGSGLFRCTAAGLLTGITSTDVVTVTTVDLLLCFNEKDGAIARCDSPSTASMEVAQVEVTPVIATFNGDGTVAAAGDAYDKIGASMDKCMSCHGDKKFHHASVDLVQCKTCHNATRTGFRGLGDLKRHVHRLHSSLDHDALDDPDANDIVDHFPSNVDNCNACHADGQFDLPIAENDRASIASGPSGDVFISPTAVVCGSCHVSQRLGKIDPSLAGYTADDSLTNKEKATVDHMIQNGAIFGLDASGGFNETNIANKVESCAVCHAVGNDAGVDVVHNLIQ